MPESRDCTERMSELRGRYPQNDASLVSEVVSTVLTTMRGDFTGTEAILLAEIEDLARSVATARAEIAALRADDITASHIPSATDELDAIIAHTATATDSILECCEQLDGLSNQLDGAGTSTVQAIVTRIYEACSFQDITGQRITKVVATLKAIESKVVHILEAFAPDGDRPPQTDRRASSKPMSPSLLNGPQLPGTAMGQSDIDALLASFD